jgi:hypothetical protein
MYTFITSPSMSPSMIIQLQFHPPNILQCNLYHNHHRYEFTKSRGQIHCHLLAILADAQPTKLMYKYRDDVKRRDKEISKWAQEKLGLRATHPATKRGTVLDLKDVGPPEGTAKVNRDVLQSSLLESKNYDQDYTDAINVCEMHNCNEYCLGDAKYTKAGDKIAWTCQMGAGKETIPHDPTSTPGFPYCNTSHVGLDHTKRHYVLYM